MEVSGVVFRSIPSFSANSLLPRSRFSGIDLRLNPAKRFGGLSSSWYVDNGHLDYYLSSSSSWATIRCGAKEEKVGSSVTATKKNLKKKMKLLKGLSKDLTVFSDLGSGLSSSDLGLAGEVQGKMISDAAELLLAQLQKLKAEEKELKRKKKEEKARLKAERMQNRLACGDASSGSSSSSESSDSECGGKVVDMSRLKTESSLVSQPMILKELHPVCEETRLTLPNTPQMVLEANVIELQPVIQGSISSNPSTVMTQEPQMVQNSSQIVTSTSCERSVVSSNVLLVQEGAAAAAEKKIEVCMGGKCKKSGAAALLDEFQRSVGVGAVVGCKCMGKCRDGPNVRVLNHSDTAQADDSVRTPISNPLCIGVGLEDVGLILSNFFGDSQRDLEGLAAAS